MSKKPTYRHGAEQNRTVAEMNTVNRDGSSTTSHYTRTSTLLSFFWPRTPTPTMKMLRLATAYEEHDDFLYFSPSSVKLPRIIPQVALRPRNLVEKIPGSLVIASEVTDTIRQGVQLFLLFETSLTLLGMGLFALCY